jgi:hypothetical protein
MQPQALVLMCVSGILLGLWPILMKLSGLNGTAPLLVVQCISVAIVAVYVCFGTPLGREASLAWEVVVALVASAAVVAAVLTVFAGASDTQPALHIPAVVWLIASGLAVSAGLIVFITGLGLVATKDMGLPFAVMIVVQVGVPIVYQLVRNLGGLHPVQVVGLLLAAVTVACLSYQP